MASLSGCIVVRNGKSRIQMCLDALIPVVNEYVVVDTGSTDGTIELVESWKAKHPNFKVVLDKVGSRFHDSEGIFDFGAAKNHALSLATSDYVMWCDVNDILTRGPEVRNAFDKIVRKRPHASITLNTRVSRTFAFPRIRIAPREFARFVGSIHEYMENTAPDAVMITTQFEFGNYKATRDIGRNVAALAKEWKREHTQRTAFYLGNSYRDVKDMENAYVWYSVVVDEFPNVLNEERFKALETMCDIASMNHNWEDLGRRSLQLIEEGHNRPEGYYYRAQFNYNMRNYAKAKKCLEQILSIRMPPQTNMWVNKAIYDRKNVESMLHEVENRTTYTDMDPMMPEHIDDGYGNMLGLRPGMPSLGRQNMPGVMPSGFGFGM